MANEKERIRTDIEFWRHYCETVLLLGSIDDALRLLDIPMGGAIQRAKAEAEFAIFLNNLQAC